MNRHHVFGHLLSSSLGAAFLLVFVASSACSTPSRIKAPSAWDVQEKQNRVASVASGVTKQRVASLDAHKEKVQLPGQFSSTMAAVPTPKFVIESVSSIPIVIVFVVILCILGIITGMISGALVGGTRWALGCATLFAIGGAILGGVVYTRLVG